MVKVSGAPTGDRFDFSANSTKARSFRSAIAVFLTAALALSIGLVGAFFTGSSARAATAVSYVEYSWDSANSELTSTTKTVTNYTVVTSASSNTENNVTWSGSVNGGWYVVEDSDVKISGKGVGSGNRVQVKGDVKLILKDGAKLDVVFGIQVDSGSSLTIYGQEQGTGVLYAGSASFTLEADNIAGDANASLHVNPGIGGGYGGSGNTATGTITIHGGDITARGGTGAAAIGGDYGKAGGTINIYNGTVDVRGGVGAAGIGGGNGYYSNGSATGGNITIYGGDITARSGTEGAGIGGGQSCGGGNITIYGGNIYSRSATVSEFWEEQGQQGAAYGGAAIGGGGGVKGGGHPGTIKIYGGDIQAIAQATVGTAAIGAGGKYTGNGGSIAIYGGTISAKAYLTSTSTDWGAFAYSTEPTLDYGEDGFVWRDKESGEWQPSDSYSFDKNCSYFEVMVDLGSIDYVEYSWSDGTLSSSAETRTGGNYTLVTASSTTWSSSTTGGWYVVVGDVTISSRITVDGEVRLILTDGATLTASKGITVANSNESRSSLTVYGQDGGTGKLEADLSSVTNASSDATGIGGGASNSSNGTVNIHGGVLTLSGGANAAGIGGGHGGSGGTINVYHGTITATGGAGAAGIGGGYGGASGTINVYGGTVTATGGANVAGIGRGYGNTATESISLRGGHITSMAGSDGSAFSSAPTVDYGNSAYRWRTGSSNGYRSSRNQAYSWNSSHTYVEIDAEGGDIRYVYYEWNDSDASLTAKTGCRAEGNYTEIGTISTTWNDSTTGGWYVVSGNISISSRVAVSGEVHLILQDGATLTVAKGITVEGSNSLTIYGQDGSTGKLTADDNDNSGTGAGIGSSGSSTSGTITIHGGTIKATGVGGAAGIGGGNVSANGTVAIYGGTITAQGGAAAAGIGGGTQNSGGTISIYGGTVTASGGTYGAGIGGGGRGGDGGTISIYGGTVTATAENSESAKNSGAAYSGAGIGGGTQGNAGSITISGGNVKASGNGASYSVGIGYGGGTNLNPSGTVTISGGNVIAVAQSGGAAYNISPTLSFANGYSWRTSESSSYTSSTDTEYSYSASHTYVEFKSSDSSGGDVTISLPNTGSMGLVSYLLLAGVLASGCVIVLRIQRKRANRKRVG